MVGDYSPAPLGRSGLVKGALQEIELVVSWADGLRDRRIQLDSVVEGLPDDERFVMSKSAGFTLVEVIVALGIFSLIMLATVSGYRTLGIPLAR